VCTFILAWQVFPDAPVAVAATRDEALGRPSEPPALREWGARVVAPKDAEANGTWLGYNEHGVLVALTNRWTGAERRGDRSRGLLVRDALGHGSAQAAARCVERDLADRAYEGFNLIAVDSTAAVLVEYDGNAGVRNLDPGVHVVVNVGADGRYDVPADRQDAGETQAGNANAVRTALRPEPGETGREWLDRAAAAVADHEFGVCVHGDGFGTRSASLLLLGGADPTYEFADGPPCETGFEPVVDTV